MKKLSFVLIALLMPAAAMAQQPAKPALTKIGVIDLARALAESAEGQRDFAQVQIWVNEQNENLKKQEVDYNSRRNRYMQEQLKMSADARADTERQIQEGETRLRRQQEDLNQELNQRRQTILNRLGTKMQQVIQQYAQDNGYLVIMVAQEGMFAFVAPAGDLTDQLIKLYDVKNPVAAAPPKK
ncbi:MAG TPA: OmpH family outer membrane protein [Acidobacteriota bacterium]|jgi:outer membrane protein